MAETFGLLELLPASDHPELLAPSVFAALDAHDLFDNAWVAEIDPALADTQAMTDAYGLTLDVSANCVVIGGKREGEETIAACVVLATTRADVNGFVRKHLNLRKASFLPMDRAVEQTGMEYGGITPIGLPANWKVLVDSRVTDVDRIIVGSGVRKSKLFLPGSAMRSVSNVEVLEGLANPA